jgi:hypothetical protein
MLLLGRLATRRRARSRTASSGTCADHGLPVNSLSLVVRRLANKVDTKGLYKLTAVTVEDCKRMRAAYGRCSALLHSNADAPNKPLSAPDVIKAEIEALSQWVTKQRQVIG